MLSQCPEADAARRKVRKLPREDLGNSLAVPEHQKHQILFLCSEPVEMPRGRRAAYGAGAKTELDATPKQTAVHSAC